MSVQPAGAADSTSRTNTVKMAVGGVALALLIIFFAQNWQMVQIHFFFWTWDTHMLWALLASAALGVVATLGFTTIRARRRRRLRTEAIRPAA